jgi:DNA polymerase/3'-5' exonuclease PolX
MSAPATNEQIAAVLTKEAETREGYGAAALLNSARIIATFPEPITNVNQLKGIRGVGKGTLDRVATILAKGVESYTPPAPSRPEPVRAVPSPAAAPESQEEDGYDFTQIKFFGPAANRNLHARGIRTLEELEVAVAEAQQRYDELGLDMSKGLITSQGVTVTANQLAGLRYREHLALRVPRAEVKEIGDVVLREAQQLGMVGEIVGSYRRGRPDSGDVDTLLTGPKNRLHDLIQRLWDLGIVRYTFSLGEVKAMLVAVRPSAINRSNGAEPDVAREVTRRSLDIRYVPQDAYGVSLLFSTGPGEFNVAQRRIAIEQGLKLSEYGLADAQGQRIPAFTEEEVFATLGMDYLTPVEREKYNPQ